jgi:hypothetical protein
MDPNDACKGKSLIVTAKKQNSLNELSTSVQQQISFINEENERMPNPQQQLRTHHRIHLKDRNEQSRREGRIDEEVGGAA